MDLDTLLHLESHGPDTYVGVGPRYPWGGLYGGQIVSQALRAAAATVDPAFGVHSLHAYFIRGGDHADPVRYEVDRIRNGRSFTTRRVVARQAVGAVLNLSASFQVDEPGPRVVTGAPAVPAPDALEDDSWSELFERRTIRDVPAGTARAWFRPRHPVGPGALVAACTLAYVSDDLPTEAVVSRHPEGAPGAPDERFMSASLDHAIWFHRPPTEGWHLHELTCTALVGTRGVATGHVFDRDGALLATVTQEVLLRVRERR